jgi:hypothetical protein
MPETFYLEQTLKRYCSKQRVFFIIQEIINLYVLPLMRIKLSKKITRMHKIYLLQPVQNKVVVENIIPTSLLQCTKPQYRILLTILLKPALANSAFNFGSRRVNTIVVAGSQNLY